MYNQRGQGDRGPRGGAGHLARIHGTEEDKVTLQQYLLNKILVY